MTQHFRYEIASLDLSGMKRLADAMIAKLPKGLAIGLIGTLGAGKTSLVQAIAESAGIDASDVTSPTFTLLQTHRGSITLHHLDAYRIADEDEFVEIGVDEFFADPKAWTLVEWADRVAEVMPVATLWIEIEVMPFSDLRRVIMTTHEQMLQKPLSNCFALLAKN